MVGVGETYLPAFALKVGMSEWLTGLFATVPLIVGALIQLLSPWGVFWVGGVKRWVVGAATLQALAFIPLVFLSFGSRIRDFALLFAIAAVYWGAGFAANPSWNFWMAQIVPEKNANAFFARRHRYAQVGVLVGLIGGGIALQQNVRVVHLTSVFSFLFLIAFFARASSSVLLSLKIDGKSSTAFSSLLARDSLIRKISFMLKDQSYQRFFTALFLFYIAMYISAPFMTPYFLEKLNLNYDQFMLAQAALFIAKIAVTPLSAHLMEKWGVKTVFLIGAIGIAPLPISWAIFSPTIESAIFLQIVGGAFWGIFELSLAVIFFGQIKHIDKISVLTIYNFFNALAIIVGSLIGGALLKSRGATLESYYFIFYLGTTLRFAVILFFAYQMRNKTRLL
jgi:predicted MFS family arabinose efflux permease